jgi:hypothetical protein
VGALGEELAVAVLHMANVGRAQTGIERLLLSGGRLMGNEQHRAQLPAFDSTLLERLRAGFLTRHGLLLDSALTLRIQGEINPLAGLWLG